MNQKSRIAGCFVGFFILLAILCTPAWTDKPPYEDLDYGINTDPFQSGGEMIGENINILMGNMVDTATDVSFPSPNRLGFSFKRTYNSRAETSGILGYGWTHSFGATLTLPAGSEPYLKIIDENGLLDHISGPTAASVPDGVWVRFGYESQNLTSARYPDGPATDYQNGSGFTYEYNSYHNLTRKRNMMNHILGEWSYDGSDRCYSHFSPHGKGVTLSYVDSTRVDATDAYDKVRTYTLGTCGGRSKVTELTGSANAPYDPENIVLWTYDSSARLTHVQYGGGRVDRFDNFDARGNPRTVVLGSGDAKARTITYTYHPIMPVPRTRTEASVTGSGNKVTTFDYDDPAASGDDPDVYNQSPTRFLYKSVEEGFTADQTGAAVPYKYVTAYTYNGRGQVLTVDRPYSGDDDKVEYNYSGTMDLEYIKQPLTGKTYFLSYDAAGYPGRITDVNSQSRDLVFDGKGRLRQITYVADGSTKKYVYNLAGKLDSQTDEDEVGQTYGYTSNYGHLNRITGEAGDYMTFGRDGRGNIILQQFWKAGGEGPTRKKRWDYTEPNYPGLLWKEFKDFSATESSNTRYYYTAAGLPYRVYDPENKKIDYTYDVFGHMLTSTPDGAPATIYTYDGHGNLETLTDPEGLVTRYVHDDMGRLTSEISPDTGTTRYGYDGVGNLIFKKDAGGTLVTYDYDALYRPTAENFPQFGSQSPYTIGYVYDQGTNGKGRLTRINDQSGTTDFVYDERGRTFGKVVNNSGVSFTLNRILTHGGRVSGIIYPSGRTVNYTREECLCEVSGIYTVFNGVRKDIFQDLSHLPFGGPSGMNVANGGEVSNIFDLDGRMTDSNPGTNRRQYLEYLNTGHLERISAPEVSWAGRYYEYDAVYRLKHAEGSYGTIDYTYDNTGNRLTMSRTNDQPVQNEAYSYYPGKNRLQAITGTRSAAYTYSVRGYPTVIGNRTLGYNADQRMIWVKENEEDLGRYVYNGLRERTKKTAGGEVTLYLYDFDGNLIVEADAQGATKKEYLYHGKSPLAMAFPSGNVYFMHNNQFGAPELITNSTNTVVWEAIYKPFGETSVNTRSTVTNHLRFQGRYFDAETGWHYNHYRYYDPKAGRYLTPDPIGLAGGINPYVYVGNDPVNSIDPSGLAKTSIHAALEAALVRGDVQEALLMAQMAGMTLLANRLTPFLQSGGSGRCNIAVNRAAIAGENLVYQAIDKLGNISYVGITNSFNRRYAEHLIERGIEISKIPGL
ncbi:MAG: RHS repeat-associated core domain-containing protein [Syntrophobacteraceae bacterium]